MNAPRYPKKAAAAPADGLVIRASSLRGSEKQRTWAYNIRTFMVENLSALRREVGAAGDTGASAEIETLLIDVTAEQDSDWFIQRRELLHGPIVSGAAAQRRALYFAAATFDDLALRSFAVAAAAELSVEIAITPMCACPMLPPGCPDLRRWEIVDHPYGPWLRILDGEVARLETSSRSSPNLHAKLWRKDGDWYCSNGLGAEWSLEHVEEALGRGELPDS